MSALHDPFSPLYKVRNKEYVTYKSDDRTEIEQWMNKHSDEGYHFESMSSGGEYHGWLYVVMFRMKESQ